MAGFLAGLLPLAGRLLSSGSLLKSAYSGGSGLVNLAMDAIPLVTDMANNDVGLKSFTGFAGTMAGTRFGGRELNSAGEKQLKSDVLQRAQQYSKAQDKYNSRPSVLSGKSKPMKDISEYDIQPFEIAQTKKYQNDPALSRQGYNMPIGMAADFGLYSLTSGSGNQAQRQQQEFSDSPVSRYIQMTGAL